MTDLLPTWPAPPNSAILPAAPAKLSGEDKGMGPYAKVSLAYFDELLTETEACERFKLIIGPRELRKARQEGKIRFVAGKRGVVHYHPSALAEYLESKTVERKSPPPLDNSSLKRDRPMTEKQLRDRAEGERLYQEYFERRFVRPGRPPKES